MLFLKRTFNSLLDTNGLHYVDLDLSVQSKPSKSDKNEFAAADSKETKISIKAIQNDKQRSNMEVVFNSLSLQQTSEELSVKKGAAAVILGSILKTKGCLGAELSLESRILDKNKKVLSVTDHEFSNPRNAVSFVSKLK